MLIRIEFVRNPKAVRVKGFIAKLLPDNPADQCLEFCRARVPRYAKNGVLVGGEYELEEGVPYIVRRDDSSWKNSRQEYQLVVVQDGKLECIAWINYDNGTPSFSSKQVKECYVRTGKPIAALVEFWKEVSSNGEALFSC